MKFTLGFPPSTNRLYATVRGRRVLSREGREYKAASALKAKAQGARPLAGPVRVEVHVYRPRRTGDLDNALKALLDSLKGIAWEDDSQVEEIHAFRHEDKVSPRVEMEVGRPKYVLSYEYDTGPLRATIDAMSPAELEELEEKLKSAEREMLSVMAYEPPVLSVAQQLENARTNIPAAKDWKSVATPASYRRKP